MKRLFKREGDYVYIHTDLGSDIFGDGSIERPFSSLLKAVSSNPSKTCVLRGVLIENIYSSLQLLGDEPWQTVISSTRVVSSRFENIRMNGSDETIIHMYNCISFGQMDTRNVFNSISEKYSYWNPANVEIANNSTILNGGLGYLYGGVVNNCIIVKSNNLFYSGFLVFRYCLFPSACNFTLNSTPIAGLVYGDDPFENIRILKRAIEPSWSEFGSNLPVDDLFGTININGQKFETCQIVKEQKDGGSLPNIFASYETDGITPLDYHLNADPQNIALHASENGSFVGALPAAKLETVPNNFKDVNLTTGAATTNNSQMIAIDTSTGIITNIEDMSGISQRWARYTTPVIDLGESGSFRSLNNFKFASGSASGFYVGKRQTLFGNYINPSGGVFSLEPNKTYKVLDDDGKMTSDTGVTIERTGETPVHITIGATLTTPADLTNFIVRLYDSSSTTTSIVEVQNPLFESIECILYDSATEVAEFPKFSCPINEDVFLLFRKDTSAPVLFSEVTNDKHSYYQDFAISNADSEYWDLVEDTANYYSNQISLRYFAGEINVNYDEKLKT